MAFPDFARRPAVPMAEDEEPSQQRCPYPPWVSANTGVLGYDNFQDWRRRTQVPWFEEEYVSAPSPIWHTGLWPGDPTSSDFLVGWLRRHPTPPILEDEIGDSVPPQVWHTGLFSAEPTGQDRLAWVHHRQPSQEEPEWVVAWQSRWKPGAVVEPTGTDGLAWVRKRRILEDVPEDSPVPRRWNPSLLRLPWEQVTWARRRRLDDQTEEEAVPVHRWHTGLWTAEPTGADRLAWRKVQRQLQDEPEEYVFHKPWTVALIPPIVIIDAMAWARKRPVSEPDEEWIAERICQCVGALYVMSYGPIPGPYFVDALGFYQPGFAAFVVLSE
jgi:hypothetical protein